jgi:hypothetical protein
MSQMPLLAWSSPEKRNAIAPACRGRFVLVARLCAIFIGLPGDGSGILLEHPGEERGPPGKRKTHIDQCLMELSRSLPIKENLHGND